MRNTPIPRESFFEAVYQLVRRIPLGRVTTYGALARVLGTQGSARMVGWAMHQAVYQKDIPAHRVVNRHGLLTGRHHFQGEHTMEALLALEGIDTVNHQVLHFEQHFWDPQQVVDSVC